MAMAGTSPGTSQSAASKAAAATKIQALFRGHRGRKTALSIVDELINALMAARQHKSSPPPSPPSPSPLPPIKPKHATNKMKREWSPPPPSQPPKEDPSPETNGKHSIAKENSSKPTVKDDEKTQTTVKSKRGWPPPPPPPAPSKEEEPIKIEPISQPAKDETKVVETKVVETAVKSKRHWPPPPPPASPKEDPSAEANAEHSTETRSNTEKIAEPGKDDTTIGMTVKSKKQCPPPLAPLKRDPSPERNGEYLTETVSEASVVKDGAAIETKETSNTTNGTKNQITESQVVTKSPLPTQPSTGSIASAKTMPAVGKASTATAKGVDKTTELPPKAKPRTGATRKPVAAGGTRIWIKLSAVNAIQKPNASFKQRLAKRPSNVSQSTDDNSEMASAVISRSTKWGWKQGSLVESSGSNITIALGDEIGLESTSELLVLPAKAMSCGDVVMSNEYKLSNDGRPICPDDLISLTHLHEPAVVECLQHRYNDNHIYSSTGPILLALNPFKRISGLYEDSTMKKYWGSAKKKESEEDRLPPHIYAIADNAFLTMTKELETTVGDEAPAGCDQSILVSGESGAGKTVTTKFAMKYLAALSQRAGSTTEEQTASEALESSDSQDVDLLRTSFRRMSSQLDVTSQHSAEATESIESQVLQSNPILESFGNARTIRNDNSSRFGKFIEMQFTRTGRLVGASIEVYLLEKVRLVKTSPGERNYHVFYELLAGDMDERERGKYFIDRDAATPEDFKLTATSTYTRRDGVTDDETYDDLMLAMHSMGFSKDERRDIFTTVAAILHASNLTFLEIDAKSKLDEKNTHLKPACDLLGVTPEDLSRALCHVTISAGTQTTVQKDLTVDKAIKGLEALLKATYGTIFTYLVTRVNEKISYQRKSDAPAYNPAKDSAASIGVLDIFGFESFKINSFEQLCINFCNEALQQQFNTFVLENEQAEYEREGINWSFINFPENQDVLDLIGKRGSGLLSILDDQCKTPGTTDKSFALALYSNCKSHVRFSADRTQSALLKFSVHHYAGAVEYSTDDFIEKNRDELGKEATELLQNSNNSFIRQLAGIIESSKENANASTKSPRNKANKTKETVGGEFKKQLRNLRLKIDKMTPHYVRCLKPNDELVQDHYDRAAIVEQLRCGGIIEAVRVARAGFSNQFSHADFVRRYSSCVWKELKIRRVRPRKGRRSSPKKKGRGPRKLSSKECSDLLKLLCKKMQEENKEENSNGDGDGDGEEKEKEKEKETNIFKKQEKASVDLSTELEKVGLQFGKTKVFLRHKAFETLERIRMGEHSKAAVKLNSVFRMFLARTEHGHGNGNGAIHIQNVAHEERLRALAAENPEWCDPTFGKETMDRYEKNREAFSGKSKEDYTKSKDVGKLKLPSFFSGK